jgi:hypothetical protein
MDCIFALFINENNDTVEEWLYYYGAFGTIVMIKFEMIMSRCRAKSEGGPLMLGIIDTRFIKYNATM